MRTDRFAGTSSSKLFVTSPRKTRLSVNDTSVPKMSLNVNDDGMFPSHVLNSMSIFIYIIFSSYLQRISQSIPHAKFRTETTSCHPTNVP
jgi:hypothetical protein